MYVFWTQLFHFTVYNGGFSHTDSGGGCMCCLGSCAPQPHWLRASAEHFPGPKGIGSCTTVLQ